jgi:class 3 adenylate cyclase
MTEAPLFGLWLKQRRKALDLTQEELAERVSCAVTTIRKLEGGTLRPSKQIAERLAKELDVPLEEQGAFVREARAVVNSAHLQPIPQSSISLPTGTVTFLFTDIEGSTRLWQQYPQAMQDAIVRHDGILRRAVEAHGGAIFKTVGDAICAAFANASDALCAALAGQRSLQIQAWDPTGPLRVRMALHTGSVKFCSPARRRNWCAMIYHKIVSYKAWANIVSRI